MLSILGLKLTMEWINIADTAIKIGLGSLISGAFTYLGVKLNHQSSKDKFILENNVKLIETVSEDVETYFLALESYVSIIAGITKRHRDSNKPNTAFTEKQWEVIKDRDKSLSVGWDRNKAAASRLRLLNAHNIAESLDEFRNIQKEIRDQIVFEHKVPTYDAVDELREKIHKNKKDVYKKISELYHSL